jgi:hypothetical protein
MLYCSIFKAKPPESIHETENLKCHKPKKGMSSRKICRWQVYPGSDQFDDKVLKTGTIQYVPFIAFLVRV